MNSKYLCYINDIYEIDNHYRVQDVAIGRRKSDNLQVAFKEFDDIDTQRFLEKLNYLGKLDHPFLLPLLNLSINKNFTVITPYMKNGNLLKLILNNDSNLATQKLCSLYAICSTMDFLNSIQLYHGILTPHKILIKDNNDICIDNFNVLLEDRKKDLIHPIIQSESLFYLSPETLENDYCFTAKVDVYSFGVIYYQFLSMSKKFYFKDKSNYYNHYMIINRVLKGERFIKPENVTDEQYNFYIECTNKNADDRPSFSEIARRLEKDKSIWPGEINEAEFRAYVDKCKKINKKSKEKIERLPKSERTNDETNSSSDKKQPKRPKEQTNYFIDSEEEAEYHTKPIKMGEGGTSITYKIVDTRTKIPMCKKVLKYRKGQTTIKDAQNAMKEFEVLYSISHPCICKAIGINIQEEIEITNNEGDQEEITTIALFLEYLDYNLIDILNKNISNTSKVAIVIDICHAMNFLHKRGMIHRDLKIENIMLNSLFETKLVDFGLVKLTEAAINDFSYVSDSLTKGVGTFAYMSPEMANEEKYNNKTDVYSFGVVLHFMFTGDLPKQSLKEKLNGKKVKMPSPSKSISNFCIDLINKCLSYKPSDRPSFDEILAQLRENSYELADDVNPSILEKRDKELCKIKNKDES